jgi:general stress protein 26
VPLAEIHGRDARATFIALGRQTMKSRISSLQALPLLLLAVLVTPLGVHAQEKNQKTAERDRLVAAARELMATVRYCALITIDARGRAQVRTMDPFPPDENLVVWLGTNPKSRKVREIRHNSRVALYYFDSASQGYVTISGIARIVDDPKEKARHWKEEWKGFYLDRDKGYVLIAVTPEKLEVVIVKKGIIGDPKTWKPPTVTFGPVRKRA